MAIRDYNDDNPVTMAGEPAVAYRTSPPVQPTMGRSHDMTVEEYFDKVGENLDKRYDAQSFEDLLDQIEAQSTTPPPCQYTVDEAVQRVLQATAEAEIGIGCLSLDEFEALVETW